MKSVFKSDEMVRLVAFGILSLPVLLVSWRTLFNPKSHGFFRFFSWECILWLLVSNLPFWFENPLSFNQVCSWIILIISVYLVLAGVLELKKSGNSGKIRTERELFEFEKTSKLVDSGIYNYIRHPLYASLFFLTWGIFLKHPTTSLLIAALLSSIFLYLTAVSDEKECRNFFGDEYNAYMKRTKRFIPFVF